MGIARTTGILIAILALSACALAPGMKMDEPAAVPGGPVVQVQQITPALLEELDARRENAVREVAQEFGVQPAGYVIGAGDVLQVIVWDHPELTIPAGSFRDPESSGQKVGEDGYMFYPYVGMVKAAGLNVAALRDILTDKLSTYIQNPQLDIKVVAFRSKRVFVVGEVATPGVLPIKDIPMTVAHAISLSGGLTSDADKSGVNISRNGKVYEIDMKALYDHADVSQNLMLQHGDIVNVLDRSQQKVYVMGEVRSPGSVEIVNGELSLSAAIGEVGGVNQTSADSGGIYIIRGQDKDKPEIFHLDSTFATGMLLAEQFELRAQDVIFVDTAGISQWNRVISQLLPSFNVVSSIGNR